MVASKAYELGSVLGSSWILSMLKRAALRNDSQAPRGNKGFGFGASRCFLEATHSGGSRLESERRTGLEKGRERKRQTREREEKDKDADKDKDKETNTDKAQGSPSLTHLRGALRRSARGRVGSFM